MSGPSSSPSGQGIPDPRTDPNPPPKTSLPSPHPLPPLSPLSLFVPPPPSPSVSMTLGLCGIPVCPLPLGPRSILDLFLPPRPSPLSRGGGGGVRPLDLCLFLDLSVYMFWVLGMGTGLSLIGGSLYPWVLTRFFSVATPSLSVSSAPLFSLSLYVCTFPTPDSVSVRGW